jgi:hypothetical protein
MSFAGVEGWREFPTIELGYLCNVYSQLFRIAGPVLVCCCSGSVSAAL